MTNPEITHQDPGFQRQKTEYFQNFIMRDLAAAREWKKNGLINEAGSESWRNVARHQLLMGAVTETIMELLGASPEETRHLTHLALIHDADKRRQQEGHPEAKVIRQELGRNELPIAATSSNFTDFDDWKRDSYVLRYADSSVAEEGFANTFGGRDPNNLPKVILVPWRQRIQGFKDNKTAEGELGRELYDGLTTWEKLEEIMADIEVKLYEDIVKQHPELAEKYSEPSQLAQLLEDRIHEKILATDSALETSF